MTGEICPFRVIIVVPGWGRNEDWVRGKGEDEGVVIRQKDGVGGGMVVNMDGMCVSEDDVRCHPRRVCKEHEEIWAAELKVIAI